MDITKLASRQVQYLQDTLKQLQNAGITPEIAECPLANTAKQAFFKSQKGIEARAMNLAAIKGVKIVEMPRPNAIDPEDIKLLASDAAEMVAKWTSWSDPKSGKMYTIINKADNPDGTKLVRILNEAGEIVKEKTIRPKKIIITDTFGTKEKNFIDTFFSHGERVKKFVQRNNPIADIEYINISSADDFLGEIKYEKISSAFEDILKRIKSGEQIDVINCSFGNNADLGKIKIEGDHIKKSYPLCKGMTNYAKIQQDSEQRSKAMQLIEDILAQNKRIIFGAGNDGEFGYNVFTGIKGVDVTGAIKGNAKIADYSASRAMTQHYEYVPKRIEIKDYGINITGKPGVDISYKGTPYEQFEGKKLKDYLVDDLECKELNYLHKASLFGKADPDEVSKLEEHLKDKFVKHGFIDDYYVPALSKAYHHYNNDIAVTSSKNGYIIPAIENLSLEGTSFAAPIRSAKIALNEAMKEILG